MADDDKPLDHLAEVETSLNERPEPVAETVVEPTPEPTDDAKARLRVFEDEHLGKDAPRINGAVERGAGSPFALMNDEDKVMHAALERLIDAEAKLVQARADLAAAEGAYAEAEAAVGK